jgi:outer membrane protein OmpA-like peptidoglycan-associated protein
MKSSKRIFLLTVVALVTLTFLFGCGGKVYAPREGSPIMYYHAELPEAAQAVESAEKAGKDKACPDEFQAAKNMMEDAYRTYWACRTDEAIEKAKKATAMANALCPQPAACTLTASPKEIQKGQSSTLTFATSGTVKSAKLEGQDAPVTGATKTVNPANTTTYTGECSGVGGTKTASATVTVLPPPPPKVLDKMTLRINFDFDKSVIREADEAELKKAIGFVKKYPDANVKIEGHTDSMGTEQYNQILSEERAGALQNYLVQKGAVQRANISTVGYGELKPLEDNKTDEGRAENRRVDILIMEK